MALYQQGNQKIEIVIRKEGGAGGGQQGNKTKPADNHSNANAKTWKSVVFGSENPQRISRVIKTNATHLVAISKQVIDLEVEYMIGGLGYSHGDQALQSMVSRKVERVKDTTNIASSIIMGGVYGAWGGPIGSVLGMAMGAVSSSMSFATKMRSRARDFDIKMFKQENAIAYRQARAQINLSTGRLR